MKAVVCGWHASRRGEGEEEEERREQEQRPWLLARERRGLGSSLHICLLSSCSTYVSLLILLCYTICVAIVVYMCVLIVVVDGRRMELPLASKGLWSCF